MEINDICAVRIYRDKKLVATVPVHNGRSELIELETPIPAGEIFETETVYGVFKERNSHDYNNLPSLYLSNRKRRYSWLDSGTWHRPRQWLLEGLA
jgi:hypothetical protein